MKIRTCIILLFGLLFLASCEYEVIVPKVVDLPDEISFQEDIIPIFDAKCNACHGAGHFVVDLTPANAYQDLFAKGFIDLDAPEQSILYTKITEVDGSHTNKATPTEYELILKWIQDGALDN